MPLVLEVLCGRHFFVQNPNCFCKVTYGGQEYSTDADQGATNPKWQKNKFQAGQDLLLPEVVVSVLAQPMLQKVFLGAKPEQVSLEGNTGTWARSWKAR